MQVLEDAAGEAPHRAQLAGRDDPQIDGARRRLDGPDDGTVAGFVGAEQGEGVAVAPSASAASAESCVMAPPDVTGAIVAALMKSSRGKSLLRYALPSLWMRVWSGPLPPARPSP